MLRSLKASVSRVILVGLPLCVMANPANAQTAPTSEAGAQLDEVVVTASRRETVLERTPQSIAVIDGDLQRDRGQQRLEDLQTSVPNISFTNTSNSSQLYIRGVGNTFINAGGDPGVAFYQDNAYVSDPRTTNTSLFDIDRVEILRGPQGALYGRNAVGGAVSIVSAKPTATPEGRIDVVSGDFGRLESEGFISGPLAGDTVRGRLSYQGRKNDGYIKNELSGAVGAPDRLDDLESVAVRAQLAADLPGGGEIRFLASQYNEDEAGPALAVVSTPGLVYPAEALFGQTPTNNPRSVRAAEGSTDLAVTTANAGFEQPLGGNILTVTLNYRDGQQNFLNDCDGGVAEACRYSTHTVSHDYYTEAYLSSPGDAAFRWTIGATYAIFDQSQNVQVKWQTLAAYLSPGTPTNVPFFIHYNAGGALRTESYAVYADLRYQLTPIWALSGQLRYSETTKEVDEYQSIPSFGVNVPSSLQQLQNEHTPFKVAVEGQLDENILVYANYATANKDGAINIGALQASPVRPEEVRSIEIGGKATFLDRRLQVNAAAFHSSYDDLQIAQVIGPVAALANAPEATIDGGELEVVFVPTGGLRLGASVGYLDGRFDAFSNSKTLPGATPGPLTSLAGNQLPYVPELSINLDVGYEFAPVDGYTANLGAQYAWRSRVYFNEFNERDNGQDAGAVVNISASIAPDEGHWRLYGYVNNLADRTYQTGSTIYSGLLGAEKAVSYAPPRNFGVGLSVSF